MKPSEKPSDFNSRLRTGNWLRLSHVMDGKTPAYGGGPGLEVSKVRDLKKGDSCNASMLNFSNHLGSHVDAQLHFIDGGKAIADYAITDWIFTKPLIVDVEVTEGEIISTSHFDGLFKPGDDADLLLIRTGFEQKRFEDVYWQNAPAYAPELADFFAGQLPFLSAVGLDTISIGTPHQRPLGHAVHKAFLGRDIRIFEDLALSVIAGNSKLQTVLAFPFLFDNADGAPCTIIGLLEN